MPEISQDQFETMYPANTPATPQQLRLRANSAGACSGIHNNNNNSCDVITESAVFDRSYNVASNTNEEIAIARKSSRQLRLLSETSVGENEMQNSFVGLHNDYFYGYKREISHRLVKLMAILKTKTFLT